MEQVNKRFEFKGAENLKEFWKQISLKELQTWTEDLHR